MKKFQGSLEYLIIIAAVLAIAAIVVLFLSGFFSGSKGFADLSKCKDATASCAVEHSTSVSPACGYCETDCPEELWDKCKQQDVAGITSESDVYVVSLHYENGVLSRNSIYTTSGFPSAANTDIASGVSAKIMSGVLLYETRFELPDKLFYDNPEGPYPGGMNVLNETDFIVALPYFENADSIVFTNITTGGELLSIDVNEI